jgi:hypothetical protein
MIWTAGFRAAVISPYEQIQLTEPRGFADQTVHQVLHMAGGGERLRVRLTNRYGRTPLTIAAATIATEHGQATLTFDGADKHTIPPGKEAACDPIDLPVAPGTDLFLSLYFPDETGLATYSHKPIALIEGFKALAHRARKAKLKILAATVGPFAGAVYPGISTPEGLAARREVNDWIRTTDTFDAVFDVARAVENPAAPDYIHPSLDSGDGMHLNDKGAQAMANAVDPETLAL